MNEYIVICRICLEESNGELICMNTSNEIENIKGRVEEIAGFKLSKLNAIPDKMCNQCLELLKSAIKFRYLCERSEEQFKNFLRNQLSLRRNSNKGEPKKQPEETERIQYAAGECSNFDSLSPGKDDEDITQYEPEINFPIVEESWNPDEDYMYPEYVEYLQDDSNNDYLWDDSQYVAIDKNTGNPYESSNTKKKINELVTTNQKKPPQQSKLSEASSFICSYCGNVYNEKAKLTTHIKVHTQYKPHECEICHKRFCQAPQLTRHINSHTGNRPYKCKYCDSSFSDPSTKIKHERIHTQERPFKCDVCDKSFAYSNVLKVHRMTHTGEKPYECRICGKKFSQLHHMKAHERIHSPERMVLSESPKT